MAKMNLKKVLPVSAVVMLLCIVTFAGLASATSSYASSVISYGGINGGGIVAPTNVLGSSYDGSNAVMSGNAAGKGAYVVVQMSTSPIASGSYVSIYASKSSSFPSTALHVYVSTSSSGPWTEISSSPMTISGTSGSWHSFQANQQFSYVKVAVWSSSTGCAGYVDSILTM